MKWGGAPCSETTPGQCFLCCSGLLQCNSSTFQDIKHHWHWASNMTGSYASSYCHVWWVVFHVSHMLRMQCDPVDKIPWVNLHICPKINFPRDRAVGSCSISKALLHDVNLCQHSWVSLHDFTWLNGLHLQVLLHMVRHIQMQYSKYCRLRTGVQWLFNESSTHHCQMLVSHFKENFTFPYKEVCFAHV